MKDLYLKNGRIWSWDLSTVGNVEAVSRKFLPWGIRDIVNHTCSDFVAASSQSGWVGRKMCLSETRYVTCSGEQLTARDRPQTAGMGWFSTKKKKILQLIFFIFRDRNIKIRQYRILTFKFFFLLSFVFSFFDLVCLFVCFCFSPYLFRKNATIMTVLPYKV